MEVNSFFRVKSTQCWLMTNNKSHADSFVVSASCLIKMPLIPVFYVRFKGAPVDVGMSIDIASIDMVSEVNMVSSLPNVFFLQGEMCLVQHMLDRPSNMITQNT